MSDGSDFNERNIAEFRANHGRVSGPFEGAPIVLLHTVGARSGKPRTNIMMYLADGERYLVFASNAGADDNPSATAALLMAAEVLLPLATLNTLVTAIVVVAAN